MNVETTKKIDITTDEIEQAIAEWLSRDHTGVMQDSTTFEYQIRAGKLDKAFDADQILDGCVVTVKEKIE